MRVLAQAIFAIATIAVTPAARAQTFSPDYPVCLHVYGPISYYDCSFTSMPQCKGTAQGRSAQCEFNPYFAVAETLRPVHHRHHRHVHRVNG